MEIIKDWKGQEINACRSRGKSRTLALVNPLENLLRGNVCLWPPPEITQKLYHSDHLRDFPEEDHAALKSHLGFYCDLQSIQSEDAITWSYFGPLVYADPDSRARFLTAFFRVLDMPATNVSNSVVWLWRRTIHPEKMDMGGPEIDFGITTEDIVVLGEAKWKSPEAKEQGLNKNRGQIELRVQLCEQYASIFGDKKIFVVVALSLSGEMVSAQTQESKGRIVALRDITWDKLARIPEHPFQREFSQYLEWKKGNS